LVIEFREEGGKERVEGLYHPIAAQAIAERGKTPKSCVTQPDIRGGLLGLSAGSGALARRNAATAMKSLCMAGKRFDSALRHAIDRRQPYRWAIRR
jgi:hypothetical protein